MEVVNLENLKGRVVAVPADSAEALIAQGFKETKKKPDANTKAAKAIGNQVAKEPTSVVEDKEEEVEEAVDTEAPKAPSKA